MAKLFGKYFKQLVKKRGISATFIAKELGIKQQSYISNIFTGRQIPSVKRICEFAKILNLPVEEKRKLITLAENERPKGNTTKKSYTFGPAWAVFSPRDIFSPEVGGRHISSRTKEDFYDSNLFELKTSLLDPFVKEGEKFFAVEYPIDETSSKIPEGKLVAIEYETDSCSGQLQIIGELTKKTKDSLVISNTIYKTGRIKISTKNIVRIAIILGKLF